MSKHFRQQLTDDLRIAARGYFDARAFVGGESANLVLSGSNDADLT